MLRCIAQDRYGSTETKAHEWRLRQSFLLWPTPHLFWMRKLLRMKPSWKEPGKMSRTLSLFILGLRSTIDLCYVSRYINTGKDLLEQLRIFNLPVPSKSICASLLQDDALCPANRP